MINLTNGESNQQQQLHNSYVIPTMANQHQQQQNQQQQQQLPPQTQSVTISTQLQQDQLQMLQSQAASNLVISVTRCSTVDNPEQGSKSLQSGSLHSHCSSISTSSSTVATNVITGAIPKDYDDETGEESEGENEVCEMGLNF